MISRSNVQRTVKTFDFYIGKTKAKRTGHFESLWQMNLHNLQDGKDQILSSKIWIRQVRNKLILVRNFPIWRDVCHKKSQDYTTRNSIIRPNDSGKAPPFSLVVSTPPSGKYRGRSLSFWTNHFSYCCQKWVFHRRISIQFAHTTQYSLWKRNT